MADDTRDRLIRLEAGQDDLRRDVNGLRSEIAGVRDEVADLKSGFVGVKVELAGLKGEISEMKSILTQLYPMMIRIDERLASVPSAADFHELRGRVEEISRRQPVTIGYTPPTGKAGTAG